jgi:hypothetical protein
LEEFGIVTGKFLERDQEVAEVDLEAVNVVVEFKEAVDEGLDLDTG